MRAAVAARLARRPPKPEAAAAPVERGSVDGDEEVTDATFDERMRAKVPWHESLLRLCSAVLSQSSAQPDQGCVCHLVGSA